MDDTDDAVTVEILADTSAFRREIAETERIARGFGRALGDALTSAVVKGKDAGEVFTALAQKISSLALDIALKPVEQGVASLLQGLLGGASGFATGGVFPQGLNGRVTPFASGGVVAAPTYFPMSGGLGLMGERGAEAILPLRRGADGKLGVAAGGTGRGMNVTVNVATPDAASFRRSDAYLSGLVARAAARGQRGL
ncbi:phage tail tape measure protein [Ancylobacter sp. 6x-1]|uniref:Phage tail tape measure protein n=1 Tax=Ancylobacter crimeensis TaxID=2579147 RepID=A0ABT0D8U2_9HYPH|nr:phage tail tape measure protein [Ancylobacter crimeensis]MCK0196344.1 phage tail tape measure protein [Ancylobacter crimeensis]